MQKIVADLLMIFIILASKLKHNWGWLSDNLTVWPIKMNKPNSDNNPDAIVIDEETIDLLYPEIYRIAKKHFKPNHTQSFQTTELVNEAYLRLKKSSGVVWNDKNHFLSITANIIRRVIIDQIRQINSQKRIGNLSQNKVVLNEEGIVCQAAEQDFELFELDTLLNQLEQINPDASRVVELKFFAGASIEETAEIMGTSTSSVSRLWAFAKVWLTKQLQND